MQDLIGKRFGRLVVSEYIGSVSVGTQGKKSNCWKCICDCGNFTVGHTNKLNAGRKVSCGCKPKENVQAKYGNQHHAWNGFGGISGSILNRIKACAKQRNITFDVTIEYLWSLYQSQNGKCKLTNLDLYLAKSSEELATGANTASLDRIDSSKGYVEGNVQWVHTKINQMKFDFDQNDFIQLCKLVANHN